MRCGGRRLTSPAPRPLGAYAAPTRHAPGRFLIKHILAMHNDELAPPQESELRLGAHDGNHGGGGCCGKGAA